MRVLVTGGRLFIDVPLLWQTLDQLNARKPITCIMEGASDDVTGPYVGADYWANQWALARDIEETLRFHAEWKQQGRKAGPLRNGRMLIEGKPDGCLAFKGERGTANMIEQAIAANVPVRKVGW